MVPTAFGFVHASASNLFYCHKDIASTLNITCTQSTSKNQKTRQDLPADCKSPQGIRFSHCQQVMGGKRGFSREDNSKYVSRDYQLTSSSMGEIHQNNLLDTRLSKCPNNLLDLTSSEAKITSNSSCKAAINSNVGKRKRKTTFSTSVCDIFYIQGLLKAVDKAINLEYKQDQDELDTLTLDEILLVLDNGKNALKKDELATNVSQGKESKLNKRKRSCDLTSHKKTKLTRRKETLDVGSVMPTTVYPSIMGDSENLELLSKAEEGLLMKEFERDAWKLCKSLWTYLEYAAEGIASCITPNILLETKPASSFTINV